MRNNSTDFTKHIDSPRSAHELCELFSMLFFGRVENFYKELSSDPKVKDTHFSKIAEKSLKDHHVINRIFRCWYQTNWLHENWAGDFDGATPRQELSASISQIGTGEAMLSVAIESKFVSQGVGESWREQLEVVPRIYSRDDLKNAGGAFLYGLRELKLHKTGVVAPNFDPEFRDFAKRLRTLKTNADSLDSYTLHDMPEELVYWRLFIENAVMGILSALPVSFTTSNLHEAHQDFVTILLGFAGIQKDGECLYISIDKLFGYFWVILSKYDKTLVPYNEIIVTNSDEVDEVKMRNPVYAHSSAVLYLLGYNFDAKFLFPADRYFNAVEIVWQNKLTFVESLSIFYYLLNNNLSMLPPPNTDKEMTAMYERFNIGSTSQHRDAMWFNPPTCFRFHAWTLEIV